MKTKSIVKVLVVLVMSIILSMPSVNVQAYTSNKKEAGICQHGSCKKKQISGSNYCSSHTCKESGCYKEVPGANERCSKHKAQYYEKLGISTSSHPITTCNYSGCSKTRATGSSYCSEHTCAKSSCTKKVLSGSKYCSSHTCSYPGCYKMVNSANERCTSHKNVVYPSSGSSSKYSGKSKNSYSTEDEYHASEYDDYEDFYEDYYDDFEGIDDAESYWEEYHD